MPSASSSCAACPGAGAPLAMAARMAWSCSDKLPVSLLERRWCLDRLERGQHPLENRFGGRDVSLSLRFRRWCSGSLPREPQDQPLGGLEACRAGPISLWKEQTGEVSRMAKCDQRKSPESKARISGCAPAARAGACEACGIISRRRRCRSRLPAGSAVRFSARHHVRRRTDPYRQVSAQERPSGPPIQSS